jgi:hypothetical protein
MGQVLEEMLENRRRERLYEMFRSLETLTGQGS